MNRKRIAFLVVVWIGMLGNWAFAAWVLFRDPERLLAMLGLGPVESTVWLFNYSVLLAILSCFYAPAAWDPLRYRVNAWLLVVARLVPASTFFAGVALGYMPRGFLRLGIADGTIGIVELTLLLRILAAESETDAGRSNVERLPAVARDPEASERRQRRQAGSARLRVLFLVAVGLGGALGVVAWYHLFRDVPRQFASDVEHFEYGSVGVEAQNGIPYWVWYVLPSVFPDLLGTPGGGRPGDVRAAYASFGLIWENGRDAPVGLPVRQVGFPRVGVNCALCHTGTMRSAEDEEPRILVGAPTARFDLQRYLRFLFACAADPRFTAETLLPAIERVHQASWLERWLYAKLVIPRTRQALLQQKAQLAWMDAAPDWGPGRSDPFNPAKGQLLGLPADGSIGNSDAMSLWNLAARQDRGLHWDGLNRSLDEIFLNSGIGNGASARSLDRPALARVQAWATALAPPRFPFAVDRALADEGAGVFASRCGSCHAAGSAQFGSPVRLAAPGLGTDAHRLESWSQATADAFNALPGYAWRYTSFRRTPGYAAVPLDGIWARAPYLHNGSVPTLAALLEPPDRRPPVFFRGYDVYDPVDVGFVSQGPAAERSGWRFDTRLGGNSNHGHLWGTDLSPDGKRALVEYLKTC